MLPVHLLPKLSPNAAKLYLVLLAHIDPERNILHTRLAMARLTELSGLSRRACTRAIRQLKDLQLLHVPRHRYHAPATYHPALPGAAHKSPSACTPPQATMPPDTVAPPPNNVPESQCRPPQAALLNKKNRRKSAPTGDPWLDLYLNELQHTSPEKLSAAQATKILHTFAASFGGKP